MAYQVLDNTPQPGYIHWQGCNIAYKGESYAIQDGYTNATYIWWDFDYPNQFQASNTLPELTDDDVLVLLNKNGTHMTVPTASVVDGGLIVPESIMADAIAANAITGNKILAGSISSDKIAAGAVGAETIAANAIAAQHIMAGAITSDHISANGIIGNKIIGGEILAGLVNIVGKDASGNSVVQIGHYEGLGPQTATFTRNSVAYKSDGSQVATNQPRFETGQFGQGVVLERGTTPLILNSFFSSYTGKINDNTGDTFASWTNFTAGIGRTEAIGGDFGGVAVKITQTGATAAAQPNGLYQQRSLTDMGLAAGDVISVQVRYKMSAQTNAASRIFVQFMDSGSAQIGYRYLVDATEAVDKYVVAKAENITIPEGTVYVRFLAYIRSAAAYSGQNNWLIIDYFCCEKDAYCTSPTDVSRVIEKVTLPLDILNANEGTIEGWFTLNDVGDHYSPIFTTLETGAGPRLLIMKNSSTDHLRVFESDSLISTVQELQPNTVYFFQFKWSTILGRKITLNDSSVVGSKTNPLPTDQFTELRLGVFGAHGLNGIIFDLRVSNKWRTDEETTAAYASGQPLPVDGDTTYKMSFDGHLQPTARDFGLFTKNGRFVLQDPQVGQGMEVWDGATRKVLIGRLDDNSIGQEIVGGKLYSSRFRTGSKTDTTYIELGGSTLRAKVNGNTILEIISGVDDGNLYFGKASDGSWFGRILRYNDLYPGLAIESVGTGLSLRSAGNIDTILGSSSNVFTAHGHFNATGGTKNCVEETSRGMVALSVRESPDVRYIDENKAILSNGECRIDIDPLFIECILPDSDETPWLIHLTPTSPEILYISEIGEGYFIVKSSDTASNSMFFWKLSAVRKGYAGARFQKFYEEGDILTSNWEDEILSEVGLNEEGI